MKFTKMHGIGNDYVYVNTFEEEVSDPAALATEIADRHLGVGGDGLILVAPAEDGVQADVQMRMFNADGSESEMCGNGVRCVAKYAFDHGITAAQPMQVQTGAGVLTIDYQLDDEGKLKVATVNMGKPILKAQQVPVNLPVDQVIDYPLASIDLDWPGDPAWIQASGLEAGITCVSMGNPHVMLYVKDVAAVPLEIVGPYLETHPIFPNRINVHFVQVHSDTEVTMRTWERGTGITLACGTGASAVCVAGALTQRHGRSILAHLPGGDLQLDWIKETEALLMTGSATEVFSGEWPA